ncbi:MAG: YihY/virulence factor BrkB family protein, partial [Actinomycetota bacterium]|nr:YihY/virulence factor BrkB family protein [Actinomycetota bacterium]
DRWPWLAVALAVQQRFSEVNGGSLAAAVTLSAFLALFPLVLVAIAIAGLFASNTSDLSGEVIDLLGLSRSDTAAEALTTALATAERSRRAASVIGLVGLVWSALGLVSALEYAYDSVWQVTGRGLKDKVFALAWVAGAAVLFVSSFAVTAVLNFLPAFVTPLNLLVGLGLNIGLFWWTSKVLCNRDVGWRPLLPGAVLAGVGLEVLKVVGSIVVPRAVASSSALYGSIGVVFAILAWLLFFGRLVVYSAALNVVLWERRHGTVSVALAAPRLPGAAAPVKATRAGSVPPS